MAVVDVKRMWSPGESKREVRGRVTSITAVLAYTVTVDDPTDDEWTARHAVGVPQEGDAYPKDPYILCLATTATAIGPRMFMVVARYGRDFLTVSLSEPPEPDPVNTPWEYGLSFSRTTEAIDYDADGNPLVNANGEPFDPPLTTEVIDPVVSITRVEYAFDANAAMDYVGSVNANALNFASPAVPIGTARLLDIVPRPFQAPEPLVGDHTYWRAEYRIAWRRKRAIDTPIEKTWWRRVANQGFYARDPADNSKLKRVRDGESPFDEAASPKAVPTLLTASGIILSIPSPPALPDVDWIYQKEFEEKSWVPLGFT